jgi:thioredoxin-like negative regulator of GroEL
MKRLHFKLFSLNSVLILLTLAVPCQSPPESAVEDPFSTAHYLLSKTDKDSSEAEKLCFAASLAGAGRFDDIAAVVEMVEPGGGANTVFVGLVNNLISEGHTKQASELLSLVISRAEIDAYDVEQFIKPLVRLGRDSDAESLISRLADTDKIDSSLIFADALREFGRNEKALAIIEKVRPLAEESKYPEDRAELAFSFAKLGRKDDALGLIEPILKSISLRSGTPDYFDQRILDIAADIYRTLEIDTQASALVEKDADEQGAQLATARDLFNKGDLESARRLYESSLAKEDPGDSEFSHEFRALAETYLKLGEIEKAESIAKKLNNSYLQQSLLMVIADRHIEAGNRSKAESVIRVAKTQVHAIDTSHAEDGRLWTSPKMDQARYQAEIVRRYIRLGFNDDALNLISAMKKPYVKASMIAEFVSANRSKLSKKELVSHLGEALGLLKKEKTEIFDARRFDVYGAVARGFAEIGSHEGSNAAFAEAIATLDKEMVEGGTDSGLIFWLSRIGADFELAKIKSNERLKPYCGK